MSVLSRHGAVNKTRKYDLQFVKMNLTLCNSELQARKGACAGSAGGGVSLRTPRPPRPTTTTTTTYVKKLKLKLKKKKKTQLIFQRQVSSEHLDTKIVLSNKFRILMHIKTFSVPQQNTY